MDGLYHYTIHMPELVKDWAKKTTALIPYYGKHAKDRAFQKRVVLPNNILLHQWKIIEAEIVNEKVNKIVIRQTLDITSDIVMVVLADGFVKTVWWNDKNDRHFTLNRSLYRSK